ncbi:MAG: zinc ABC transporter substrate-binding protein, partial [Bacilli bacterium]|nr:zinc ABC transporter substrate-binding protein [Bacilli bacterium]
LNQYIKNNYLKKEIDEAYEKIKIELSELDAEIRLTAQNATRKTIIVNSDSLLFLEKYGFTVISLDEQTNPISEKKISDVKEMIQSGEVKHLFLLDKTDSNEIIKQLIKETGVETYTYKKVDNMTDTERDSDENYMTLMTYNIDLLKSELY